MYTNTQLSRHNRTYHDYWIRGKRSLSSLYSETDDIVFDANITDPENEFCEDFPRIPTFNFGREQSSNYFRHDYHGLGPEYLVGYSVFELNNVAALLDKADVSLEILIALLASTLSRGQRVKLAMILGKLVTILDKRHPVNERSSEMEESAQQSPGNDRSNLSIVVPTNPSMLRRRIMEGKYAILPNLPHPTIQKVGVHAYVSLKEIIADFLAHGTPFEKVCATTTFWLDLYCHWHHGDTNFQILLPTKMIHK